MYTHTAVETQHNRPKVQKVRNRAKLKLTDLSIPGRTAKCRAVTLSDLWSGFSATHICWYIIPWHRVMGACFLFQSQRVGILAGDLGFCSNVLGHEPNSEALNQSSSGCNVPARAHARAHTHTERDASKE